jgi:hypothetical protein
VIASTIIKDKYSTLLGGRIALYESEKASSDNLELGDFYLLIPIHGGSLQQHLFLFIASGGLVSFQCWSVSFGLAWACADRNHMSEQTNTKLDLYCRAFLCLF